MLSKFRARWWPVLCACAGKLGGSKALQRLLCDVSGLEEPLVPLPHRWMRNGWAGWVWASLPNVWGSAATPGHCTKQRAGTMCDPITRAGGNWEAE